MAINDRRELTRILRAARVIAVVGHSDRPQRTSYVVGRYLRAAGYRVDAVNPTIAGGDGEKVSSTLAEVPEPIDIVDVFRRSEFLGEVVDQAIAVGAKAIWAQLGVYDEAAAKKAEAAGLEVVMDRCIMVDHRGLVESGD